MNKPSAEEQKPRTKREATYHRGHTRAAQTHSREHRTLTCPACRVYPGSISLAWARDVIAVPLSAHRCDPPSHCSGLVCSASAGMTPRWMAGVLEHGRLGVRWMSLIATVRTVILLHIRERVQALHGVRVGGEAIG